SFLSPTLLQSTRAASIVLGLTAVAIGGFVFWAFQTQLPRGSHPETGLALVYGLVLLCGVLGVGFLHAAAAAAAWWGRPSFLPFPGFVCLLDAAAALTAGARAGTPMWALFLVTLAVLQASAGTLVLWAAWAK